MNKPDISHIVQTEQLDFKYYFQSLLEAACSGGLLSESNMQKIQMDLFVLLADFTDKWNRGESSSIRLEKAQDILSSISFVLGVQLKSYPTPEQAVYALRNTSLKSIHEKGMQIIRKKLEISRMTQQRIINNMLKTPNVYYRSTIMGGIHGFFKLYNPLFTAHEIHITADYPVHIGRPDLNGIEFIESYLHCLEAENAFCALFNPCDIHNLLCGLTQDYQNIPMNLYEPVLLSALGLILTCHIPDRLNLTKSDLKLLYHVFTDKSDIEMQTCLEDSITGLTEIMKITKNSKNYAFIAVKKCIPTIKMAVTMGTLDKVFLIPQ